MGLSATSATMKKFLIVVGFVVLTALVLVSCNNTDSMKKTTLQNLDSSIVSLFQALDSDDREEMQVLFRSINSFGSNTNREYLIGVLDGIHRGLNPTHIITSTLPTPSILSPALLEHLQKTYHAELVLINELYNFLGHEPTRNIPSDFLMLLPDMQKSLGTICTFNLTSQAFNQESYCNALSSYAALLETATVTLMN